MLPRDEGGSPSQAELNEGTVRSKAMYGHTYVKLCHNNIRTYVQLDRVPCQGCVVVLVKTTVASHVVQGVDNAWTRYFT